MPCLYFSFADPYFALSVIWGMDTEYHRARLEAGQHPLYRGARSPSGYLGVWRRDPKLVWVLDHMQVRFPASSGRTMRLLRAEGL